LFSGQKCSGVEAEVVEGDVFWLTEEGIDWDRSNFSDGISVRRRRRV